MLEGEAFSLSSYTKSVLDFNREMWATLQGQKCYTFQNIREHLPIVNIPSVRAPLFSNQSSNFSTPDLHQFTLLQIWATLIVKSWVPGPNSTLPSVLCATLTTNDESSWLARWQIILLYTLSSQLISQASLGTNDCDGALLMQRLRQRF